MTHELCKLQTRAGLINRYLNDLHKGYILCNLYAMELAVHTTKQRDRKQALYELAVQQQGFFTAGQAQDAGYSKRLRHHHKTQGNWEEHGWGLYRLSQFPHGQDEDLVKLTLWSRNKAGEPQAVVSHHTALRVFELSDVLPDKYHLTVPPNFRKKEPRDVILHHARLEPKDLQMREGFSVTTPLRTLIDVAENNLALEQFGLAVREALEQGLVRRETLAQRREEFPEGYYRAVVDKVLG
jgi:predicted transcriptional regulator of viral defense system